MRGFFHSRLFIFVAAVLLLSVVLLTMAAVRDGAATPLTDLAGVLLSPLQKGASAVSGSFERLYGYLFEVNALREENQQLREQVSDLEARLRDAAQAEQENDALRQMIGLTGKIREMELEAGEIIAVSAEPWGVSYTVDRGSAHGVEMNDCVLTGEGLVGYVSEVGTTFSRVTTVIDAGMSCGAILSRSREVAVAEGDFNLFSQNLLRLSYLKKDADVRTGDTVETSGLGGLFPKGVLIGTIVRVEAEDHGISNYAVVRPAVDLDKVKQVFIVKNFTVRD